MISEAEFYWNFYNNFWRGSYKYEYTYDQNSNETSRIRYKWDNVSNTWVIYDESNYFGKFEYTYDQNGNMTSSIIFNWYEEGNVWENVFKYEYSYDQNGNRILKMWYRWNTVINVWVNYWKYEYTYDQNGNITSKINYKWNTASNSWVCSYKYEYTYDQNGDKILEICYSWDTMNNVWENWSKYENTYDQNGNEILEILYNWNTEINSWINNMKYEYTYDQNGNETLNANYKWDFVIDGWVGLGKYEYTYDQDGNKISEIMHTWDDQSWSIRKKEYYYYYYSLFSYSFSVSDTICDGDSMLWHGDYYDSSGVFYANYTTVNGCDSIYELSLSVNSSYHYSSNEEICDSDSLLWHNNYYLQSGTYYDSLTTVNGCDSIYELSLSVMQNPSPFTISGQDTVALNQTREYTVPDSSNLTYNWNVQNGTVIYSLSQCEFSIQWNNSGTGYIYVVATNQHGCTSDTAKLEVYVGPTDIRDIVNNKNIIIYPNPAKDVIYIYIGDNYSNMIDYTIKIVNTTGIVVFESNITQQLFEIDVDTFGQTGLHFIQIIDNTSQIIDVRKLILE